MIAIDWGTSSFRAYRLAFTVLGIEANALDPDSVTKGLFRLAAYL